MVGLADAVGVGLASVLLPALALVAVAARYSGKPGVRGFVVAVVGLGCWSLATGVRVLVHAPALRFGTAVGQLVFTNVTILGWALLVVEFVHRRRIRLASKRVAAVLAVPVCTVGLALTNDWHHLMYAAGTHVTAQGYLQFEFGPWYPIHTVYLLSVSVGAAATLIREVPGSSGILRRQVTLLFGGWLVATVAVFDFFLEQVGAWPFPPYVDVTPVGFLLGSALWGLALFRHGLFELVPIGRRTAVETMPDAVLTADRDGRIVDANPAARALLDGNPVRQSVSAVFADHPNLLEHYRNGEDGTTAIQFLDDGAVKHFAATTTPITERGTRTGTVIVLRDVTALKSREQELDLHRQVHSRIVRHNIRNELTIIRGSAEEIVRANEGQTAEFARTILERSDELVGTSEKARQIMRIIETDSETLTLNACCLVETIADAMQAKHPDARIETTHPDSAWVTAHEDLDAALENLVGNAIVHNEGTPRVEISVERRDDTVEITVADDGPGIPEHEVAVLDQLEETALDHSSGAGLWLVNWVVMKSDGTLEFDVSERGTTVTLRLQAATVQEE
ncbi:histidine kinase N-terminal 7TM domain-containing protein [Halorientalis brevis]|uniref:histidine kinase n=1 Tax=Halorientalis brevis TaxID=1126241 RepID=A0ABD6C8I6_9EURY|nr:histidine kinase N-terminal 7TM domain-containing protein [Halorientalis brevis]